MLSGDAIPAALILLHLASTLYMVGLIWFVQIVHYPLLARVGAAEFGDYERAHVSRTTPVVGPPMLVEAATAFALVAAAPTAVPVSAAWLGLVLLALIWLSTALLQVPRHRELSARFEARAHGRLVATNWIRTACWTTRGLLALWIVYRVLVPVP